MTKREMASLAFKILGVYFAVEGLVIFIGSIYYSFSAAEAGFSYFAYGGLIVAGLLLWFWSDGLARSIFKADSAPTTITPDTGVIAFSVLGYYVIVRAIEPVANTLSTFYHYLTQRFVGQPSANVVTEAVTAILLLLMGFWLVRSAGKLSGALANNNQSDSSI